MHNISNTFLEAEKVECTPHFSHRNRVLDSPLLQSEQYLQFPSPIWSVVMILCSQHSYLKKYTIQEQYITCQMKYITLHGSCYSICGKRLPYGLTRRSSNGCNICGKRKRLSCCLRSPMMSQLLNNQFLQKGYVQFILVDSLLAVFSPVFMCNL